MAKISINVGHKVIPDKLAEALTSATLKGLQALSEANLLVEAVIINPNSNPNKPEKMLVDVTVHCIEPYVSGLYSGKFSTSYTYLCVTDPSPEDQVTLHLGFSGKLVQQVTQVLNSQLSAIQSRASTLQDMINSIGHVS